MILQRVTIVMHSMTKKSSNSWTQRNNFSNTLALAILVILLSNAVTMTEQRSISSIYKTSSSQEKDTAAKVETEHKIIRRGQTSWLIPNIASHKITGKLIRFNEKYPNIIDIKIERYTMGIFKSVLLNQIWTNIMSLQAPCFLSVLQFKMYLFLVESIKSKQIY